MTGRMSAALLVVPFLFIGGVAQDARSMKGYELYSWKVGHKWHYSLLIGTNRNKSIDEIVKNKNIKIGDEALRAELKKLAKGQEVFWLSEAPRGSTRAATKHSTGFKHPSRKRIERLMDYCNEIGIKLTLL